MALNTELLITLQKVKGVGNKTILKLAQSVDLDTIEDLCEYWEKNISVGRLGKVTTTELVAANHTALRIIDDSEREGIGIISYFDDMFPKILRTCINEKGEQDPPIVLYYRGNLKAMDKPGIAVVGTREPTDVGYKAGVFFSRELANSGFNIVSGLAIGCDTSGHKGALEAHGTTTAFLATSLAWNDIYPQKNVELAKDIVAKGGLLLSEYHLGQRTGRFTFVARDRLQAGLCYATLVIQTGETGGTYHAIAATKMANKPLYMVQFKNAEDLNDVHAHGNVTMLAQGEALPLNTRLMPAIIRNLKNYVSVFDGKAAIPQSLFDLPTDTSQKVEQNEGKKCVIFDLDLTLVDTTCLEHSRHSGNWREAYRLIPYTHLYEGIDRVFEVIRQKGIKVTIVSSSPRTYIERVVSYYHIPATYIVGYHDASSIKPHPGPLLKALALMGEIANNVVSFGDRVIDIMASNAAGIESVACLWGTKEYNYLQNSGYTHAISTPEEILNFLA